MGNYCGCDTDKKVDQEIFTRPSSEKPAIYEKSNFTTVALTDYPSTQIAVSQKDMNTLTDAAKMVFTEVGEWKERDDGSTKYCLDSNFTYKYLVSRSTYRGQFEGGLRHGLGLEIDSQGGLYSGNFHQDFWHGSGRQITPEGHLFEGEFKQGKKSGKGRLVKDGVVFTGSWINDRMNGSGEEKGEDFEFKGRFLNDEREGHGVLKWSSGKVYDGDFTRGLPHGDGVMLFEGDSLLQSYEGSFVKGRREGSGLLKFKNGDIFEGEFEEDLPKGKGTLKVGGEDGEKKVVRFVKAKDEGDRHVFLVIGGGSKEGGDNEEEILYKEQPDEGNLAWQNDPLPEKKTSNNEKNTGKFEPVDPKDQNSPSPEPPQDQGHAQEATRS